MNQARSGDEVTKLKSPSKVSKSESENSSSSKTMSEASFRRGKDCTKSQQEREKRTLAEAEKEQNGKEKSRKEEKKRRKEEKKRRQEEKKSRQEEKKQRKIEKEKREMELKVTSNRGVEAIETRSSESDDNRRSVSVSVGQEANSRQQCEECQHHHQQQMTALRGSITSNRMVIDAASINGSINSSICTGKSCFSTEEIRDELYLLSCQLKTANETIHQLDNRNARMSDLVELVKTEEQLEYRAEENKDYCSHVRALEQALILQESELDNALTVIRQNAERERVLLKAGKTTNLFASEDVDEQHSIRKVLIASEEAEELKAVRGELEQAQQERDMAVDKATAASIQLAELKAETDESRDQLTESHALFEQMRALMWQEKSATSSNGAIKRGFVWSKDNGKPGMSSNEDECSGSTDDITSVLSED
jgi:hypothetical protein